MFLTWLAGVLRGAGLTVVEWDGWQTRCRSSTPSGYNDGRPWGVMWHHSASNPNTSPEDLANFTCCTGTNAPIANVNVERDGTVWLLAAGPTNTNGKGGPYAWSKGTVPLDSMNSYAFGMELTNNGVGQPYPQVQIDAAFAVSNAVNARCGNRPTDVGTHYDYAPTRKIDPATCDAVEGRWKPRSVTVNGTWSVTDVADECQRRAAAPTPEDDMALLYVEVSDAWARFVATGQREPLILWQVGYTSGDRAQVHAANLPHVAVSKAQLGGCSLFGKDPPPADDGGSGIATWDPERDFFEWVK